MPNGISVDVGEREWGGTRKIYIDLEIICLEGIPVVTEGEKIVVCEEFGFCLSKYPSDPDISAGIVGEGDVTTRKIRIGFVFSCVVGYCIFVVVEGEKILVCESWSVKRMVSFLDLNLAWYIILSIRCIAFSLSPCYNFSRLFPINSPYIALSLRSCLWYGLLFQHVICVFHPVINYVVSITCLIFFSFLDGGISLKNTFIIFKI